MAGYNLSVSFIGAEELKKALDRGSQVAKEELAKALNKAAQDAVNDMSRQGGAPHKTGALWNSLHVGNPGSTSQWATADSLKAVVGTNLEYAKYQERGTGLYGPYKTIIKPKNAKA